MNEAFGGKGKRQNPEASERKKTSSQRRRKASRGEGQTTLRPRKASRAAVIGAGFGGLAAAIRLAAAGYKVRVYEKNGYAGGKAGSFEEGGYRFDKGPSLVTMLHVFDDLFEAAGARREDYLGFVKLDPICTYYFDDGTRLEARGDPQNFADEVGAVFGENPAHVKRFLEHSRRIYRRTAPLFLERSLRSGSTFLEPAVMASLFKRGKLDIHSTMDEVNRKYFDDSRLVQLFDRYATYNGSDPFKVPGTLNIIPHVEYNMGGYAVDGGIYEIPKALRALAEDIGVEFSFDTEVEEIVRTKDEEDRSLNEQSSHSSHGNTVGKKNRRSKSGAVAGIRHKNGFEEADVVVSDLDARRTYETLLGDAKAPFARRYAKLEPSSSGLVFFWGMRSEYPELGVNNIFFSGDYVSEFRAIFDELQCPDDPTVYVNITSKVSSSENNDVPDEGGENWFVLVNAARNAGQDWEAETERVREAVVKRLSRLLGKDIGGDIAVEEVLTPPEIEADSGSMYGSLYGISSNSRTAAFLRHPARTGRYPNLFFVGGSVHPGGGMPLALLSGKIAAEEVVRRYGMSQVYKKPSSE